VVAVAEVTPEADIAEEAAAAAEAAEEVAQVEEVSADNIGLTNRRSDAQKTFYEGLSIEDLEVFHFLA
jgi:hypothetical protein